MMMLYWDTPNLDHNNFMGPKAPIHNDLGMVVVHKFALPSNTRANVYNTSWVSPLPSRIMSPMPYHLRQRAIKFREHAQVLQPSQRGMT